MNPIKHRKTYIISILIAVGFQCFAVLPGYNRELIGKFENRQVSFRTVELTGGEYVQASQLAPYFPSDKFQYDAFSGTVVFTRRGGAKVGLKAEEERVIVDARIFHTGTPVLRKNGRILIPFYIVNSYLFPGASFQEGKGTSPIPVAVSTPSADQPQPTLGGNVFVYPSSATPGESVPVPSPTYPTYIFNYTPGIPTPVQTQVAAAQPVYSAVVVLDPGNDQTNPGAVSTAGIREHELTLSVCEKIIQTLKENKSIKVILTRSSKEKEGVSIEQRIAIANKNKADVFVSVHCGGLFSSTVSRSTVYFMNPEVDTLPPYKEWTATGSNPWVTLWHDAYKPNVDGSLQLAKKVNERLQTYYQKAGILKSDSNPRPGRLSILRGLTMPGIVIELGNLLNADTARFLSRDRILQDIAGEIAIEISNFILDRTGMAALGGKR